MAALQHVYVTAHGGWSTGPWVGENAQIGIRLAIVSDNTPPDKGTVFAMPLSGDVVGTTGTTAGTNGTLTQAWTARLGDVGSLNNADGPWQADLADDFWTFLNALAPYWSNKFAWTHVKVAPILATGKYGAGSSIYTFTTPLVGAAANPNLPPEVAVAASLRAQILGRRGRGRMYLPAFTTAGMDGDGLVASTLRTAIAAQMKTLVTNFEDAPGTESLTPLVVVTSAGSLTAVRPQETRVGNHFDVQRRRQQDVVEAYTSLTL